MNLIFLDIDETLNCIANTIRCKHLKIDAFDFQGFNPVSIGLLRELVTLADAKIVLSSTWRMHYKSFEDCQNDFEAQLEKHFNWPEFPIIGMTEVLDGCRGDEIKHWLSLHHYTNYVIIDDSRDMLEDQMNHFVRVDYREGFNFKNFIKCLNIFGIESHFQLMKPGS